MLTRLFIGAVVIGVSGGAVAAQEPLRLERTVDPIRVDGLIEERTWQTVAPVPLVLYQSNGSGLTERTEIRVAYDDESLYIGASLFDSDPDGIQVYSLARDVDVGGDFLNVVIDNFNDNQNALAFTTTPAGARIDAQMQNDAEGPSAASYSWDGHWEAAATRDEFGWYAEMRIPFSSLRFQDVDGRVVMGLIVHRLIGRKNERHIFPAIPPNWAMGAFKPSMAQDVVLEGVRSRRPIFVKPYVIGARRSEPSILPSGAAYEREGDLRSNFGGDLKYAPTNNLNLDLTVNTDFAETEVDDQRVNLSRFSLFFPERRQFFLEREGIFDFGVSGVDRPFYSRRIGLAQDGKATAILGGARVTGRVGAWDVGVLSMQSESGVVGPSENMSVLRVRRTVGNENSYIGVIATSRVASGSSNVLFGSDAEFQIGGNDYVTLDVARTFDQSVPDLGGLLSNAQLRVALERRSRVGVGYSLRASVIDDGYRPELGFVNRSSIVQTDGSVSLGKLLQNRTTVRQITPSLEGSLVATKGQVNIESWYLSGGVAIETVAGAMASFGVRRRFEDLRVGFPLSADVGVPQGSFGFNRVEVNLSPAQGWRVGTGLHFSTGGYFDGQLTSLEISPLWNVSPRLRFSGSYRYDVARFPARATTFEAHVARLRVEVAADSHLSGTAFVQINTETNTLAGNVRVRLNVREGNDLWIVYGHTINTDRGGVAPVLPRTGETALVVKYTYTFIN